MDHPPALNIRRAHAADLDAIQALTRTSYEKWIALIGRPPRPMTVDLRRCIETHQIDLLFKKTQLLGLIDMVPQPDHLLIESLAVMPGHQGQGLGSTLLAHAEAVAAQNGAGEIRLYTNKLFAENLAFYGKRGFETVREEPVSDGSVVHFRKRLR